MLGVALDHLRRAVGDDGPVWLVGPPERRTVAAAPWLDDEPAGAGRGPLAGVLAAVRRGGGLILGAYMPLVPSSTLQVLPHLGRSRPAAPRLGGRPLALCAYWPAQALDALEGVSAGWDEARVRDAFVRSGGLAMPLDALGLAEEDAWMFSTVHTPYDLEVLRGELERRKGMWEWAGR